MSSLVFNGAGQLADMQSVLRNDDAKLSQTTAQRGQPAKAEDAAIVERMARIGVVPGRDFDPEQIDFLDRKLLRTVLKLGLLEMGRHLNKQPLVRLHKRCWQLGHGLPAARHGQPARAWLEPSAGRHLSASCRPRGIPSTNCKKGSPRSLRAGTGRRSTPRREALPTRCGSSPPRHTACESPPGCP